MGEALFHRGTDSVGYYSSRFPQFISYIHVGVLFKASSFKGSEVRK
jgi:hypothetical protein